MCINHHTQPCHHTEASGWGFVWCDCSEDNAGKTAGSIKVSCIRLSEKPAHPEAVAQESPGTGALRSVHGATGPERSSELSIRVLAGTTFGTTTLSRTKPGGSTEVTPRKSQIAQASIPTIVNTDVVFGLAAAWHRVDGYPGDPPPASVGPSARLAPTDFVAVVNAGVHLGPAPVCSTLLPRRCAGKRGGRARAGGVGSVSYVIDFLGGPTQTCHQQNSGKRRGGPPPPVPRLGWTTPLSHRRRPFTGRTKLGVTVAGDRGGRSLGSGPTETLFRISEEVNLIGTGTCQGPEEAKPRGGRGGGRGEPSVDVASIRLGRAVEGFRKSLSIKFSCLLGPSGR